jgi:hypothetical protein
MIKKVIRVGFCLLAFLIWRDLFLYANFKFLHFHFESKNLFLLYIIALALFGIIWLVFSKLNNEKWIPFFRKQFCSVPTVGILINAKSINENKFKECLMSLKKQNYEQIDQIIIINF